MSVPEKLTHRIELFKATGKVFRPQEALFSDVAWQQVMIGQGLIPQDFHPIASGVDNQQLKELMNNLKTIIDRTVNNMPKHRDYIAQI